MIVGAGMLINFTMSQGMGVVEICSFVCLRTVKQTYTYSYNTASFLGPFPALQLVLPASPLNLKRKGVW